MWVDETTRQLTSSAISYRDEGAHALKGKAEPVALWSARAVTASVRGVHRSDELEAPLVGRDRELRLLKELFHGVEDSGRPGLVLVDGDAGLGKSRLAWELEKYLDGLQVQVGWLIGRCAAYGDGVAFQPLADAVRGRLQALAAPADDELDETAGGTTDAAADGDALLAALAGLAQDDEERAWLRPRVAVLLGAGTGAEADPDERVRPRGPVQPPGPRCWSGSAAAGTRWSGWSTTRSTPTSRSCSSSTTCSAPRRSRCSWCCSAVPGCSTTTRGWSPGPARPCCGWARWRATT